MSVFIPIPQKSIAKESSNYCTIALNSHTKNVMLKVIQARLQQYVNHKLLDFQAGFRKGRETRDQIANICWIIRRRRQHPTPVLLPGKSHGQRRLVGCSPWGRQSQTRLSNFTFTFHFYALEKEMATHSSVLAWKIPGMGILSLGSHRVRSDLAAAAVGSQKK